jgi:phage gp37-like protein
MKDTTKIEDAAITALKAMGSLKQVETYAGQLEGEIETLPIRSPAAFVLFGGDTDNSVGPRPVPVVDIDVLVVVKSAQGKKTAARGALAIIDAVRDAFNGKRLGLSGMGPFKVTRRELLTATSTIVVFRINAQARNELPVPVSD